MLPTDLFTHELGDTFERFCHLVGEASWRSRAAAIESEMRGQPILRAHLAESHHIVLALDRWSHERANGAVDSNNPALYPAYRLAAQALAIIDHAPSDQKSPLIRRIQGALRNPDDMRALLLELTVATHFVKRGHTISWPELVGMGRFDIFVEDIGASGLEVECKSASEDKGRRIHRRDALEFHALIRHRLEPLAHRLSSGLGGTWPTKSNARRCRVTV